MNSSDRPDPLKRFSNRVDNYIRYRPHYPEGLITFFNNEINFNASKTIADIGSGTGILSELFLKNGNTVYGVEPNKGMRLAAEELLRGFQYFISINAAAENTTLPSACSDVITAGQAFHWFDVRRAKKEFKRILKPHGYVILIWNSRINDASPFLHAFEELLINFSTDYAKVNHKNINEEIFNNFFSSYKSKRFPNSQKFDFEGLKGRLMSASYAPVESHPNYLPMMKELIRIFDTFNSNGFVEMVYETEVYYGRI